MKCDNPYNAGQRVCFRGVGGSFTIESVEWVQRIQCVWDFMVTARNEETGEVVTKHADSVAVVL